LELTIESSSAVVELDWVVFDLAEATARDCPGHMLQQNFLVFQLELGSECELGALWELGRQHRMDGLHLRYSE
jgi:hypothetical protein